MKKFISFVLSLVTIFSILIVPTYAISEADNHKVVTYTIELQPREIYSVNPGRTMTYGLGYLNAGDWVTLSLSTSPNAKVGVCLYRPEGGANYSTYTLPSGNAYWEVKKSGTHQLIFNNDNNYSITVNFTVYI